MKSERLDLILEERGLAQSRQVARGLIMAGAVLVNGQKVTKPGTMVKPEAQVELLAGYKPKYVSRGGLKLEKALVDFQQDVTGLICIDVGASTGGFTDCLLQHGAEKVFAIDVGYGQIEWKLRQDQRVVVKERVNARKLTRQLLEVHSEQELPSLAVIDVSFISLVKVLPATLDCMTGAKHVIALIKPQFEAGPEKVGKGGVVRDPKTHIAVLKTLLDEAGALGLVAQALTFSPIKGPKGNIEFLVHWKLAGASEDPPMSIDVDSLVADAHEQLSKSVEEEN